MTESDGASRPTPSAHAPAVFDASPLILLDRLGYLPALRHLRGHILIPEAVSWELSRRPDMPGSGIPNLEWVEVREVEKHLLQRVVDGPPTIDSVEAETIALGLAERANVVIDDLKGRERARRLGVSVTGMLGELVALHSFGIAAAHSCRSPEEDLDLLSQAGMRLTAKLRSRVLWELKSNR